MKKTTNPTKCNLFEVRVVITHEAMDHTVDLWIVAPDIAKAVGATQRAAWNWLAEEGYRAFRRARVLIRRIKSSGSIDLWVD